MTSYIQKESPGSFIEVGRRRIVFVPSQIWMDIVFSPTVVSFLSDSVQKLGGPFSPKS